MSFGVVELGAASDDTTGSGATAVITTTATAPAGSVILVIAGGDLLSGKSATVAITNCRDSASNTYSSRQDSTTTNVQTGFFYAENVSALASGGTISVDWSISTGSGAQHMSVKAYAVTGAAPSTSLDAHGTQATSAGTTTPSATTATLVQAVEAVFGYVFVKGAVAGPDTFTEASGFTSGSVANNANSALRTGYQITAATTAVTYAPTLGTSRAAGWNVISFRQDPGPTLNASLAVTLGAVTSSATATVAITASASIALGALTLSAQGTNPDLANLAVTLGALTLSANLFTWHTQDPSGSWSPVAGAGGSWSAATPGASGWSAETPGADPWAPASPATTTWN